MFLFPVVVPNIAWVFWWQLGFWGADGPVRAALKKNLKWWEGARMYPETPLWLGELLIVSEIVHLFWLNRISRVRGPVCPIPHSRSLVTH